MSSLLDLTLPAVKDTPVADLTKMIGETPDFEAVAETKGAPLLTEEDVRTAARKYIRKKIDIDDETPEEAKAADPKFVPPASGFLHVTAEEVRDPERAMIKAGFVNKEEGLRLIDAIRRDETMLGVRRSELDQREQGIRVEEAKLEGRRASLEKKSLEVSAMYAENQKLFGRLEEARKSGVQI